MAEVKVFPTEEEFLKQASKLLSEFKSVLRIPDDESVIVKCSGKYSTALSLPEDPLTAHINLVGIDLPIQTLYRLYGEKNSHFDKLKPQLNSRLVEREDLSRTHQNWR